MHDLEGLIADLGTAGFRERLYGALDGLAPTDHVSLLRHGSDGRIRLVCTASRPRWRFAQEAQRAYLERFHALDPNREALSRPPAGALVRRLRREQVPGADYRHYCYDAARLVDRLSVLCADAAGRVDTLGDRLLQLQRGLSRRELAVAARVLAGMTSEGIAADLGIGLQSVLTYRKRAYAKLGVCGQRELFALALLPQGD
ncbi:MAG: helix-turn-helix transcriptional regulator [Rhodocyclaceae bacterium]|nr:helix-turn-helix transcriptional regulator [Rhodocyclaceae bacterium]